MLPRFTAIFLKTKKWYLGWIEEIPGVNTQGKTLKEARENLKEALELVVEANREINRPKRGQRVIRETIALQPA